MAWEDLVGSDPSIVPTGTMADALDAGLRQHAADTDELATEREVVRKLQAEYAAACAFDAEARKKYAANRSYASGKALKAWYSSANLIASFIDILVSFLYAKNPDVSVRPAKQVMLPKDPVPPAMPGAPPIPGAPAAMPAPGALPAASPVAAAPGAPMVGSPLGDVLTGAGAPLDNRPMGGAPVTDTGSLDSKDRNAFAQTMGLIIPRLWKDAKLKRTAKRMVRSALTTGIGWCKAIMFSETSPNPQVVARLRNKQDALKAVKAKQAALGENYEKEQFESYAQQIRELEQAVQGLEDGKMRTKRGQHIDHCRSEDIQVSLDVASILDYLDAGWMAQALYVPKDDLKNRFQREDGGCIFSEEDLRKAKIYYQRPSAAAKQSEDGMQPESDGQGQFSTERPENTVSNSGKPVEFVKIVELWDKRDGMVKTFVEGIDLWAEQPYPPAQASTRFYPYLGLALYEVDGQRHPDSLPDRLEKMQDEYSASRSSGRKTRERSIPGTVFNAGALSTEDAQKIEKAEQMEMVGIRPTDPNLRLDQVIAEKPVPKVDPRMFDTTAVQADMEKLSGVQEALQSSVQVAKTATEANIQQSGFTARTSADRDSLEDVLDELALHTAETAIQEITPADAERIAGPEAFWPFGMEIDDIFTMLSIEIDAGTTGKPKEEAERQAWASILPMLTKMVMQIRQVEAMDPALSMALRNLLRETVRRLDDRLDIDQFLANGPPPMLPPMELPSEGGADNMSMGTQPGEAGTPPPA